MNLNKGVLLRMLSSAESLAYSAGQKHTENELYALGLEVGRSEEIRLRRPTRIEDLKVGTRVILYDRPEEGVDRVEVGVIDWIADGERPENPGEGVEAIVLIPVELRDWEDRDGLREVFFDEETLKRTEVF